MRIIKIVLLALLVLTGCLFGYDRIRQSVTGAGEGPAIQCDSDILEISVRQPQSDLLAGVTASDPQDGDLTDRILVGSVSKLIGNDTAKVTYLVFDSDNNSASRVRWIRYTDYRKPTLEVKAPLNFAAVSSGTIVRNLKATDVLDGDISDSVRISVLSTTERPNVYAVTAQVTNGMGDTARVSLPVIVESYSEARPTVTLKEQLVYLDAGSRFDARSYLASAQCLGGSVPLADVNVEGGVDTDTPGDYWVYYSYTADGLTGLAILTVVIS